MLGPGYELQDHDVPPSSGPHSQPGGRPEADLDRIEALLDREADPLHHAGAFWNCQAGMIVINAVAGHERGIDAIVDGLRPLLSTDAIVELRIRRSVARGARRAA